MAKAKGNSVVVSTGVIAASLASIAAFGPTGTHLPEASLTDLVAQGLVETNPNVKDAEGNVAVRASQKGLDQLNASGVAPANDKPKFVIAAVPKPEKVKTARGRAAGGSLYPFESLEIGQAFFVPNTEEKPNAAKSLASTVTTANARYSEETGENETVTVTKYQLNEDGTRARDTEGNLIKLGTESVTRPIKRQVRQFEVMALEDGAAFGQTGVAGAGVWRIL